MSHINGITESGRSALAGTVLGPREIDLGLKQMVAFVVSSAAGWGYC